MIVSRSRGRIVLTREGGGEEWEIGTAAGPEVDDFHGDALLLEDLCDLEG
jgi:hypothetical protein